jgi:transposase
VGVDATVALSIVAAVGDFTRFRIPEKLVAYLGSTLYRAKTPTPGP